jgi:tetratricopeptide (TPR) repeat protein
MQAYRIKIAAIFILFGLGILFHLKQGLGTAWFFYVASFLFILTHFLYGTVRSALNVLQTRDYNQAELLLSKNKHPEWLIKASRAYYHFAYGIISLQHEDLEKGKVHFQAAADIGLRDGKDNALAYLNLAHIAYVQKNVSVAHGHLKKAQSFETNDLIVKENLQKLGKALKRLK